MKSLTPRKSAVTVTQVAGALAAALVVSLAAGPVQAAPVKAPLSGEIERITLNNPADYWTGGTVVVGGQTVILPRNLLLDLPANRLTLWQLVDQAPEPCKSRGETGLAKGDTCNLSGTGAIVSIAANRTNGNNVIAGDVLIEKGREAVTGVVTYINYDQGYLRIDGVPGSDSAGLMARMNDPTSRHTIQVGAGCGAGPNCSPDDRFGLDADNYTNTTPTGYPMCLPSTIARPWAGLPQQDIATALGGLSSDRSVAVAAGTAQAAADGTGDALCPSTNRTANFTVADSRRFAPILVGDTITLEGSFETVGGVRFLSFHTSSTALALATRTAGTQPDYVLPEEVFVEAPAFQNLRARTLIIGFSTLFPDILVHTLHYDPITGTKHEKPFATTRGCDNATAANNCAGVGILGTPNTGPAGGNVFRIRYDIDFVIGALADLDPCAQLRADPRMGSGFCPNWVSTGKPALYSANAVAEMFAILSPIPHEVQMRTGHLLAAQAKNFTPTTVDVNGQPATNGQYLYPFGINLGGIETADFLEINAAALGKPFPFSGIPWNLDRRLSPNGCKKDAGGTPVCEGAPQPLEPFPYEGLDPRTQTDTCGAAPCALPTVPYNDSKFTALPLSTVRNRVLSYMTRIGTTTPAVYDFAGNASVLAWPPTDPAAIAVDVTPTVDYCVSELGNCLPPRVAPVCGAGEVPLNGACVVPVPDCTAGQVLQNNVCVTPVLACGTGQVASGGFCVAQVLTVPTCTATQALQNNVCVTKDIVTIPLVTWVAAGGGRGLTVVAKSNNAAANLVVTAAAGTTNVLSSRALTRVTTNQGTVVCTTAAPCWTLARTRTVLDTKPTSVVVTSDKLGTATATSGF